MAMFYLLCRYNRLNTILLRCSISQFFGCHFRSGAGIFAGQIYQLPPGYDRIYQTLFPRSESNPDRWKKHTVQSEDHSLPESVDELRRSCFCQFFGDFSSTQPGMPEKSRYLSGYGHSTVRRRQYHFHRYTRRYLFALPTDIRSGIENWQTALTSPGCKSRYYSYPDR